MVRHTPEDETILARRDQPFSPLTMFVCTYQAVLSNIRKKPEALIRALEPRGPIRALNCNFGHKFQPGYERFEKRAAPPAPARAGPAGQIAAAIVRVRKRQGDGTCFNSALEVTVIPGPSDDPPPRRPRLLRPDARQALRPQVLPRHGADPGPRRGLRGP